jgi:hypothetical protein
MSIRTAQGGQVSDGRCQLRLVAPGKWARTYAAYRNTIEGLNGYMKDPTHEALQCPARRRVRGIAAQSLFCGLLAMAANVRKIAAHRALLADALGPKVAERARRQRMSITDYEPSPPGG